MTADALAALREIASEHRSCGPKYDGCYSHVPMPHCRACGMAVPCDVERIAALAAARPADSLDMVRLAKACAASGLATPHEAIWRARAIAAEYAKLADR